MLIKNGEGIKTKRAKVQNVVRASKSEVLAGTLGCVLTRAYRYLAENGILNIGFVMTMGDVDVSVYCN